MPNNETAPVERQLDEGPGTCLDGRSTGEPRTPPLPGLPTPLHWTARFISAGGPDVPAFGSAAWQALPDGPAKVAAVCLAAEAWRTYWEPAEHTRRLRLELDEAARVDAEEAELDATWTPVLTTAERRSYAADRPSYAELCERRGEPDKAASARQRAAQWQEVA